MTVLACIIRDALSQLSWRFHTRRLWLPSWKQARFFFPPDISQWQATKCRNANTVTNQRSATHAHLFIFIAVDKFNSTCSFTWGNRLNTSTASLVNWNSKVLSLKLDQKRSWNVRPFSCRWKQSTPCKVRTRNYVFNDFLNRLFTPAFSTWNERPEQPLHNINFLCCITPGER